jgi:hypothetical protein
MMDLTHERLRSNVAVCILPPSSLSLLANGFIVFSSGIHYITTRYLSHDLVNTPGSHKRL